MGSFKNLDSLLDSFVKNGPAGCSLVVSRRGETLYEKYIGYADLQTKKPIAPDTIFRIYSMSKVITCTAALIWYERGAYLLNDPLEAYLPEFKNPQVCRYTGRGEPYFSPAAQPIQIKDLFCMTSGYTYTEDGSETEKRTEQVMEEMKKQGAPTTRQICRALSGIPLAFDPGTHFKYGMSHDILGALIEALSGKTLGQFMQDEIFTPLGMKDTFFRIPEDKRDRLCSLYDRQTDGSLIKNEKMDGDYQPGVLYESGGGGLLSTLGDYSIFAQTLAAGGERNGVRLLGRKTIEMMATNHLSPQQMKYFNWPFLAGYGYGLGVRVLMDKAAGGVNGSLGEFGWSGLAGTWALMDPAEGLSAVYMQQMFPHFEEIHQPRLRAVIYGAL